MSPLFLSIKVASCAIIAMLPIGLACSWWLAHGRQFRGKIVLETIIALPLVMPPTVVGYLLLTALGRGSAFGRWLNGSLNIHLLFTWQGAAVAGAVMAFPLFVSSATAAFASIDRELLEASRTLGAGEFTLFVYVIAPLSYRGLLAALMLGFARALGEFGATFMVAGTILGSTQTLPVALYDAVQQGNDKEARFYVLLMSIAAFALLAAVGTVRNRVAHLHAER